MLPFLPKSRAERVISLGLDDQGTSQTVQTVGIHTHTHTMEKEYWLICILYVVCLSDDSSESSNSLASLYSKWNNPVFVRPPMVKKKSLCFIILSALKFRAFHLAVLITSLC